MIWYPSILCIGSPGGGKSFGAAWDALHFPGTCVIADPHRDSLAALVLEHAEGNVLYDRLSDVKNTLGYELLKPSTLPDPAERTKQNHRRAQLFVEIMMRRRSGDVSAAPLMEEWITALPLMFLFQSRPKPLWMLPSGLTPGTDEFRSLVRDCTLPDVREKFEQLADLKPRSLRSEVGSSARLVTAVFRSPSWLARCNGGFDLYAFLQQPDAKLVIEKGDEVDDDATATIIGGVTQLVIDHVKARKHPWPPIRVWLDEATTAKTAGRIEARAVMACRKNGLSFCFMCQNPSFPHGTTDDFFQGCKEKHFYQTADPDLARKLAGIVAAEFPDGGSRADQVARLTTRIMKLKPGWRYVTGPNGGPDPQYVPLLDGGWPDWPGEGDEPDYRERMRHEKLCEIYSRSEYAASASARGAEPETTSPSSLPSSSSPARRLKPRGRKPTGPSSPSDAGSGFE